MFLFVRYQAQERQAWSCRHPLEELVVNFAVVVRRTEGFGLEVWFSAGGPSFSCRYLLPGTKKTSPASTA